MSDAIPPLARASLRNPGWVGGCLFLFAFAWFGLWGRGFEPTGDERETLEVARGLYYLGRPERVGLQGERPGISKYGIGQSLVDLPGVALDGCVSDRWLDIPAVFRIWLLQLPGAAIAAFAVWTLCHIALLLDFSVRRAICIALAAAVSTPLWAYARTLFADLTVCVCLLGALWGALRFETSRARARDGALTGLFLAFAAITKFGSVVVIPFFLLHAGWVCRKSVDQAPAARAVSLLSLLVPIGLAGAWMLQYNKMRYGQWLETGYWVSADRSFGFGVPLWIGMYGMLFSSGKSVFLYSPLLVPALFGWRSLLARRPAAGFLLLSIILSQTIFYARWWAWHGDWSWGIRHILFVYLLGILPLGELAFSPRAWTSCRGRLLSLGLPVVLGFLVNLLGVLVWRPLPFYLGSTLLETPVFKEPLYKEGEWEIRDDFAHYHFMPDFSPIAVNAWLVRSIWNRERWSDHEIASRAPWMRLNKAWKTTIPRSSLLYDTWWAFQWGSGSWGASSSLMLLLLTTIAVLSLSRPIRLLIRRS